MTTETVTKTEQLQFTANKEDLAIISKLTRATSNLMPNVQIEAISGDYLMLTTSDGNLSMQAKVHVVDAKGEALTMNAKKLSEVVSRISGKVNFNNGVFKFGKSKLTIPVMGTDNFITINEPKGEPITINSKELINKLRKTIYAIGVDSASPIGGITININEVAATDGNVMAVNSLSTDVLDKQIIIPKSLAEEIVKNFADTEIKIVTDGIKIMVSSENLIIISTLITGQYPKYQQLVPKSFVSEVVIDKIDLLQALDVLSLVKNDKTNLCKIQFTTNALIVSTHGGADVGEGQTEIEVEYSGEEFTTGFSIEYLKNVLKNTDGDVVTIGINGALSAFAFKSNDTDVNILMPISVKQVTNAK